MLFVKDDNTRLFKEIKKLRQHNMALMMLLVDLRDFCDEQFGKDVIVTGIFRTDEEQQKIYGKRNKKKSPHQFWHGVDIRSRIFSREEINTIVDYICSKYDQGNYYAETTFCHEVGNNGMHFHIQYVENY